MTRQALFILLCAISSHGQANLSEDRFHEFERKFHRNYSKAERPRRQAVFMANLKRIAQLQEQDGEHAQFSHLSPFADLTVEEYSNMHGYEPMAGLPCQWSDKGEGPILNPTAKAKDSLDYVQLGATAPVKNQGGCPTCWAFGATAVIEGRLWLDNGKAVSLSEQYLMDCQRENGLHGCNGGLTERALHWLVASGKGIPTENAYPYTQANEKCKKGVPAAAHVLAFGVYRAPGTLEQALTQYGPVAQAWDPDMIQFYKSGILTNPICDSPRHVMTIVGYGTENNVQYWKIRNSFGTEFGEAGYWRLVRNSGQSCSPAGDGCVIAATSVKASSLSSTPAFNGSSVLVPV